MNDILKWTSVAVLVHQTSPLNSDYRGEHPFPDTWDQKYIGFRCVGILEHLRALLAEQPAENLKCSEVWNCLPIRLCITLTF